MIAGMAGRPPLTAAPPFGQRMAAARKRRGLSQAELAGLLGIARSMIDYYERRATNPTLDFIERTAAALKVSTAELVGREMPRKRPGPSPKLQRQLEEIQKLPKARQKFVLQAIDLALKSGSA